MKKKAILVITDGIGHNESSYFNAFAAAKKPNYDFLFKNSAHSLLASSGLAVGLPQGQMGNSEVGHMTIGAGRTLYQNLVKIDKAIEDGSLREHPFLKEAFQKDKRIHIIGLFSDGGVHSHFEHFKALYSMAEKNGSEVFAHIITDGRDVSPYAAYEDIKKIEDKMKIASLSGRFYAMDRDKRFERIQKAYEVIVQGKNAQNSKPSEYIQASYKENITDEFLLPASFNDFQGIREDDEILFINFRNDRVKELLSALIDENFSAFPRERIFKNIITMTNYDDKFKVKVLFENEKIEETLSEVIAEHGLRQMHIAETEKYAHVTFFFNGGKEEPVKNEKRVLIPSPKVRTYDEKPEMSAYEIADEVVKAMDEAYDFIVVNFANGDMVGHTGNFQAAVKAVEAVDECLGKIIKKAQEKAYSYMQVSDHGNCEAMKSDKDEALTNHTIFEVYCFVLDDEVKKIKNGTLSSVAPTILKLMGLERPKIMDEALF